MEIELMSAAPKENEQPESSCFRECSPIFTVNQLRARKKDVFLSKKRKNKKRFHFTLSACFLARSGEAVRRGSLEVG